MRFEVCVERHPKRRNAEGEGDALLFDELRDVRRLQMPAAEDELRARHHSGVRDAPAVGVEHGDQLQNGVAFAERKRIGHAGPVAVQEERSVAVEDAFGVACSARGVAERGGGVLFERGPGKGIGGGGIEQCFVVVVQDDDAACTDVSSWRIESITGSSAASTKITRVSRVIGDVCQLIRREARVQCMKHVAGAGSGVIELKVMVAVPAKRSDAVTWLEIECFEHVRKTMHAPVEIEVGVTVHRAIGEAAGDFLARIELRRTLQDVGERERVIHHQARHTFAYNNADDGLSADKVERGRADVPGIGAEVRAGTACAPRARDG